MNLKDLQRFIPHTKKQWCAAGATLVTAPVLTSCFSPSSRDAVDLAGRGLEAFTPEVSLVQQKTGVHGNDFDGMVGQVNVNPAWGKTLGTAPQRPTSVGTPPQSAFATNTTTPLGNAASPLTHDHGKAFGIGAMELPTGGESLTIANAAGQSLFEMTEAKGSQLLPKLDARGSMKENEGWAQVETGMIAGRRSALSIRFLEVEPDEYAFGQWKGDVEEYSAQLPRGGDEKIGVVQEHAESWGREDPRTGTVYEGTYRGQAIRIESVTGKGDGGQWSSDVYANGKLAYRVTPQMDGETVKYRVATPDGQQVFAFQHNWVRGAPSLPWGSRFDFFDADGQRLMSSFETTRSVSRGEKDPKTDDTVLTYLDFPDGMTADQQMQNLRKVVELMSLAPDQTNFVTGQKMRYGALQRAEEISSLVNTAVHEQRFDPSKPNVELALESLVGAASEENYLSAFRLLSDSGMFGPLPQREGSEMRLPVIATRGN